MRRILMLGAALVAALAGIGAVVIPADAGEIETSLVVRKTVQGPATGGFAVHLTCDGITSTLNFDATGAPTTFSGDGTWAPVNGAWQFDTGVTQQVSCTFTETDPDGATSTSWTCAYETSHLQEVEAAAAQAAFGCDAPSGTGTGPVGATLEGLDTTLVAQKLTVHFTNTIPEPEAAAEPVEAAPTFTG